MFAENSIADGGKLKKDSGELKTDSSNIDGGILLRNGRKFKRDSGKLIYQILMTEKLIVSNDLSYLPAENSSTSTILSFPPRVTQDLGGKLNQITQDIPISKNYGHPQNPKTEYPHNSRVCSFH